MTPDVIYSHGATNGTTQLVLLCAHPGLDGWQDHTLSFRVGYICWVMYTRYLAANTWGPELLDSRRSRGKREHGFSHDASLASRSYRIAALPREDPNPSATFRLLLVFAGPVWRWYRPSRTTVDLPTTRGRGGCQVGVIVSLRHSSPGMAVGAKSECYSSRAPVRLQQMLLLGRKRPDGIL